MLAEHTARVDCVAMDSVHVVTGSSDMTARVWRDGVCIHILDTHRGSVDCVLLCARHKHVCVTVDTKCTLRAWYLCAH